MNQAWFSLRMPLPPVQLKLSSEDLVFVFLSMALLLAVARALGEVARRFGQPAVIGELTAGILLGPSWLGAFAPEITTHLFPQGTPSALFLTGFTQFAVVLFLFLVGFEIQLSSIRKQKRTAFLVSLAGVVVPFAVGLGVAHLAPDWVGKPEATSARIFELFFATALAISALPVIAKILLDLGLLRSDVGVVIMAAAICDDLIGWIIFALILGWAGVSGAHPFSVGGALLSTVGFVIAMLFLVRPLVHHLLGWMKKSWSWPGGALWVAVCLALCCAAFTEWMGVHALFGAFLAGVAIGDSSNFDKSARQPLEQFTMSILAPIFFATVGLRVDFVRHFDLGLAAAVLFVACVGKILGCGLAAKWGGMPWSRAWAVGFAMNARGAMEIILGLVALDAGLIDERLFVALVVMALVTSLISGPAIRWILNLVPGSAREAGEEYGNKFGNEPQR